MVQQYIGTHNSAYWCKELSAAVRIKVNKLD